MAEGRPQRKRLSRPWMFMQVAQLHGERSSCLRAQVGVTATRDDRIIASGYVGAPRGMPHCLEVGCDIDEQGGCVRSTHAESNLISWCAREGISLKDASLWCTHAPCYTCAKLVANLDIKEFIFIKPYRDDRGVNLLMNLNIPVLPFQVVGVHSES